jgi:flavin reductase (DIM6/NTAB) family NADH-FMN oxidoreductase RutF
MHYDPVNGRHGLKFDPFKALVVPRPIGWIGTLSRDGVRNLAPYSFFNAVSDHPPIVMFSSHARKDSLRNIEATGEFTCSLATYDLRDQMNLTSATVSPDVDEFKLSGLSAAPSVNVKAPRVGESPAAFECRFWQKVDLPATGGRSGYTVVFGIVVGIHIDDRFIRDGLVDTPAMKPLARLGYMDYSVLSHENVFSMKRPTVSGDGREATVVAGAWDGVYR